MTFPRPGAFDLSPPLRNLAKLPSRARYNFHLPDAPRTIQGTGARGGLGADPVDQTSAGAPVNATIAINVLGLPVTSFKFSGCQ
jgi:hypothetical protein